MTPIARLLLTALLCSLVAVFGEPEPFALSVAVIGTIIGFGIYLDEMNDR